MLKSIFFVLFTLFSSSSTLSSTDSIYDVYPKLDKNLPRYTSEGELVKTVSLTGEGFMSTLLANWQKELNRHHPGSMIKVEMKKRQEIIKSFIQGNKSLIFLSDALGADDIEKFKMKNGVLPTQIPFAVDSLAVYVHVDNPLDKVSLEELRGLFTQPSNWGQWGLSDDWKDSTVQVQARKATSYATKFFQKLIGSKIMPEVQVQPGPASVVSEIMQNPFAVGFGGIGYRTRLVKPLKISQDGTDPYVEPTFESAISGDYPLRQVFYIYANPTAINQNTDLEVIKFVQSYEGQIQVIKSGFLPFESSVQK